MDPINRDTRTSNQHHPHADSGEPPLRPAMQAIKLEHPTAAPGNPNLNGRISSPPREPEAPLKRELPEDAEPAHAKRIKKEDFKKNVSDNPADAESWLELAKKTKIGFPISLENGKTVTKEDCYYNVIQHSTTDKIKAEALIGLADIAKEQKGVVLLNNRRTCLVDLYLKALSYDRGLLPNLAKELIFFHPPKELSLPDGTSESWDGLLTDAINKNPDSPDLYLLLAWTSFFHSSGENSIRLNGKIYTREKIIYKAIKIINEQESDTSCAYALLSCIASPRQEYFQLPNGDVQTKSELLKGLIEHNPQFAPAYYNLASTLPNGGSIQLNSGEHMTKQQLYLKAIELDPLYASTYHHLANTLPGGGSIQLNSGEHMTKQQLYLKTIGLDPRCAPAYHNLATTLPKEVSIQLNSGEYMTREQLIQKAKELAPNLF